METLEIAIGETLEARSETLIPAAQIRVVEPEHRVVELQKGIEMLGLGLHSARFTLSCSYLRDAIFFDAAYVDHNEYTHALLVILKCAQAIEVLFGSERDAIRAKCTSIGIAADIVESQIIPIVLARSSLGPAHASAFVPMPREADILRLFSKRAVHTVRQLLLHICNVEPQRRSFLAGKIERDRKKEKLVGDLEKTIKAPAWSVEESGEVRYVVIPDPRLG